MWQIEVLLDKDILYTKDVFIPAHTEKLSDFLQTDVFATDRSECQREYSGTVRAYDKVCMIIDRNIS